MLQFRIDEDIKFEQYAETRVDALKFALRDRVNAIDAELQRRVVANLTGGVLQIRTGKAARSVEIIPAQITGNTIEGAVQAGGGVAPYLRMQEDGTSGPYEIIPDRAKALRFVLGGKLVFARKVIHPGLAARRPVGQAFDGYKDEALAQLKAVPGEVAN